MVRVRVQAKMTACDPSVSFAPACAITVIWPSTFKMIVSPISVHLLHLGRDVFKQLLEFLN